MTTASEHIRLGRLPSGTLARATLAMALLAAPATGIGWWQITTGGQASVAGLRLSVLLAAAGTTAMALALLLAAVAWRQAAGGRLDRLGLRTGRRRLAWSDVSRLGLRGIPGGREVLVAYPKDETGAVPVGGVPPGRREDLLRCLQEWFGGRIEDE